MSPGSPSSAGPRTTADAPSPKIMRDVRTLPILSENFSAQTTSTGRSTSCSRRVAALSPYGKPAHAAMRSNEACVWKMPSWPDSHVATDGISFALVHEQKITAPISSGSRPGRRKRRLGGLERYLVQAALGVQARLDAGLARDVLGAHRRPAVGAVAD